MPLETHNTTKESLRRVMKAVPDLSPEDSLDRFAQHCQHYHAQALPIVQHGYLQGVFAQKTLFEAFRYQTEGERAQFLTRPLRDFLQPAERVISPTLSISEIEALFLDTPIDMLPVVDEEGFCLGMVLASDLIVPSLPPPRPTQIGGMATPFGVYLTDGNLQAGASNLALVASGMLLGLFFALTLWTSEAILRFGYLHGLPKSLTNDIDIATTTQSPTMGLMNVGMRLLTLTILLLFMRMNRLAGFHAAEHQTVHAIERNEVLLPEIVARMPRAHPRCGTNIMAGATLFFVLLQLALCIPYGDSIAPLVALFGTLSYWRRFGAFLQEYFTTRTASPTELASGIRAGEQLLQNYWSAPPSRPRLWRRIWCMGLAQNMTGVVITLSVSDYLRNLLQPYLHL